MLTELEIINAMLASTGMAPLTTNDTGHPFYVKAQNKLATANKELQSPGWWFNSAVRTLSQDVNGEVVLPSTTLHADPVDRSDKLTIRGTRLYDLKEATSVLNRDVKVEYVELVGISDLPLSALSYLKAKAVFEFYRDEDGNQPKIGSYKAERDTAWVAFKGEHLKNVDVNFFNGTSYLATRRQHPNGRLTT